jgi:Helix-turn-helix domain
MFPNSIPVEYVSAQRGDLFVPLKDVAAEFSVCTKTLKAWTRRTELGFPAPVNIRGRWFFPRKNLEEWKAAQSAAAHGRPGK